MFVGKQEIHSGIVAEGAKMGEDEAIRRVADAFRCVAGDATGDAAKGNFIRSSRQRQRKQRSLVGQKQPYLLGILGAPSVCINIEGRIGRTCRPLHSFAAGTEHEEKGSQGIVTSELRQFRWEEFIRIGLKEQEKVGNLGGTRIELRCESELCERIAGLPIGFGEFAAFGASLDDDG